MFSFRADGPSDEPWSLPDLRPEAFEMFDLIEKLRAMLRGSYVSNIDPAVAKMASEVARDHRLSERGENLANAPPASSARRKTRSH